MTVGMYAGTFDPVTNGHLDIVRRAAPLFDQVIVAVAESESALFSTAQRTTLFAEATADIANVRVISYDVLTVDAAQREGASVLVRGLRAITDFEYELDMALMNRKMAPALESVFFMTSVEYLFVSGSRIRELARFGHDVSDLVPPSTVAALREKFRDR